MHHPKQSYLHHISAKYSKAPPTLSPPHLCVPEGPRHCLLPLRNGPLCQQLSPIPRCATLLLIPHRSCHVNMGPGDLRAAQQDSNICIKVILSHALHCVAKANASRRLASAHSSIGKHSTAGTEHTSRAVIYVIAALPLLRAPGPPQHNLLRVHKLL